MCVGRNMQTLESGSYRNPVVAVGFLFVSALIDPLQ